MAHGGGRADSGLQRAETEQMGDTVKAEEEEGRREAAAGEAAESKDDSGTAGECVGTGTGGELPPGKSRRKLDDCTRCSSMRPEPEW